MIDTNSLLRNRSATSQPTNSTRALPNSQSELLQLENQPEAAASRAALAEANDMNQAKTLLVLINNQLANFRMRINEKDTRELNRRDWCLIACTLDRFCLLVYTVVLLMGLFIIFV